MSGMKHVCYGGRQGDLDGGTWHCFHDWRVSVGSLSLTGTRRVNKRKEDKDA